MTTIVNTINGFTITVEVTTSSMLIGDKPVPDYCKFAVTLRPGRMKFKETRNHSDRYYLDGYDAAMAQYREFVRYATKETAQP